jgi:hypothetical protein
LFVCFTLIDIFKALSFSGGISGGKFGISASVNAAYSQEKSVAVASQYSAENRNNLAITTASCLTSKVSLQQPNFHPSFLQNINSITLSPTSCADLVAKYGTHYYTFAEMGGQLKQVFYIFLFIIFIILKGHLD